MRDRNEIRKARALQVKKEKRQLLFIITIIILVGFVLSMSFLSNAKEITNTKECNHYESIVIKDGDSLWSIVHEYDLIGDASVQEAIDDLMYLNNMNSTTIYEGKYLIICQS